MATAGYDEISPTPTKTKVGCGKSELDDGVGWSKGSVKSTRRKVVRVFASYVPESGGEKRRR